MKNVTFLLLCTTLFFFSCSKDGAIIPPQAIPNINFANMQIDQTAAFERYTSDCESYPNGIEMRKDTLMLKIIAQDGNTFTIEEYFTPGSETYINGGTAVLEYSITHENDYILIPERGASQLFWFYANDTIQLSPTTTINLQQENCTLFNNNNDLFIGNDIGRIQQFKIGTETIRNKYGVSCVPGWFDVDAYLIYEADGLSASHVVQSGNAVLGWKLID